MTAAEAAAVVHELVAAGVGYVVSGGWGIDALAGRQTRRHDDLDVGVDALRLDEVIELLARRGYVPALDQRPARLELHAADGRKVDLHPIAWDRAGNGRQQGFGGEVFDYPAGEIVEGRIIGQPVRCISAELQREFHAGQRIRARDRADLAVLDSVRKSDS